nr:helix-turn-helix transcriptional regulator [Devosia sp. 1635]
MDWSQDELARKASVTVRTIRSFERGSAPYVSTLEAIHDALVRAGIAFTNDDTGVGVTMRHPEP